MKQKKRIRVLSIILILVGVACIALGGLSKLGVIHVFPSAAPQVYDWSEMDLSKDNADAQSSDVTETDVEDDASTEDESEDVSVSDESVEFETEEGGITDESQS